MGAPNVRWVVTSRAPLRVEAEVEYPVRPLPVPPGRALATMEAASAYASIQLFVERAGAANRAFAMTGENASAVVEVCRRLDGLPLALELAAARMKILSPSAILDRLDDRFRLLAAGRRDAPERHQTIRATIEWSHDLLGSDDKELFARLAVFDGGWTLDAAEQVLDIDAFDLLDRLTSLADNSLIQKDEGAERFRFLETIRAYAVERFAAFPGREVLEQRHARYFFDFAHSVRYAWADVPVFEIIEPEVPNFHRAIRHSIDVGDYNTAARIVGHLGWYWQGAVRYNEALALIDDVHGAAGDSLDQRSQGLFALIRGALLFELGQLPYAERNLRRAIDLLEGQDEEAHVCWAVKSLGWLALNQGRTDDAPQHFEQAQRLADRLGLTVLQFECD
jgi:predicted ATPase